MDLPLAEERKEIKERFVAPTALTLPDFERHFLVRGFTYADVVTRDLRMDEGPVTVGCDAEEGYITDAYIVLVGADPTNGDQLLRAMFHFQEFAKFFDPTWDLPLQWMNSELSGTDRGTAECVRGEIRHSLSWSGGISPHIMWEVRHVDSDSPH